MLLSNQHRYRVQVELNFRDCGSIYKSRNVTKNNGGTVKECLLLVKALALL